jgi:hypothetical protein
MAAIGAGAVWLVGASAAPGATQIGQTFAEGSCSANFTWLQGMSAPGGTQYAAPFDGVITSWSVATNASAPQLKFKVGHAVGGDSFRIVGESEVRATAVNSVNTFPTQISVQAGDVIGFYTVTGPAPCLRPATGYRAFFRSGDLSPNATATFGFEMQEQQLNIAAALEPDCDSDGFGDETQDGDLLACDATAPGVAITKAPKNRTTKRRANFEFTGTDTRAVASFQCSLDGGAFTVCTSPHTVKVKKGKHTFQVRAVDQAGNVGSPSSDSWKRKKKR